MLKKINSWSPIDNWEESNHYYWSVRIFFVFLIIFLFARLGENSLPKWDDLLHAATARGFLQTGDWLTPHYNGNPSFFKPPLYFWMEAALFKVMGVSEYAARLPAVFMGLGTFILTYLLAKILYGRKIAFFSVLILATSPFYLKYCRRVMLDVPITFAGLLGIYSLVRAKDNKNFDFLYGVALALGYYFKAIQGLPVLIIGPMILLLIRQHRRLFRPTFLLSHVMAAVLISLWIVPEIKTYGDLFITSQCALTPFIHRGLPGNSLPFYAPLVLMVQVNWPWIPVSLLGLYYGLREKFFYRNEPSIILGVWIGVILLSLMSVNVLYQRYLIPLIPPLSICAALALNRLIPEKYASTFGAVILSLMGLIVSITVLTPFKPERDGTEQYALYQFVNVMMPPNQGELFLLSKSRPYEDSTTQGVNFYANRYITPVRSIKEFLDIPTFNFAENYGITTQNEFSELEKSEFFKSHLNVLIRLKGDVFFKFTDPRTSALAAL